MVDLARAFAARYAPGADTIASPGPDALLPAPGARLEGPTFEEWLNSEDAAALAL